MHSLVIALGSNLGPRALHLKRGIDELKPLVTLTRVSRIRESDPIDAPPGSPRFLNMVVAGFTTLPPAALLRALQEIERREGRPRGVRNAPRTLDLDIILYGALRVRTPELTLPHPRYLQRDFVLIPMRELGVPLYGMPLG